MQRLHDDVPRHAEKEAVFLVEREDQHENDEDVQCVGPRCL